MYFPNVESVEDASEDAVVEVTRRDVSTSERKKHAGCAMAVACKRAMHLDGVIIATSTAYLIKGNVATRLMVPEHLSREVVSFDRGATFEPGRYTLKHPSACQKIASGRPGGRVRDRGTGRPLKTHVFTKNVRAVLGSDKERD